ncbi:Na+/H+ antiporter subunit E [Microbacterium aurantiacum]|uniref:Na+/H+ antiporter subunit E n=1 Tax=Microbacterium aurantiacum TaxID=162393 RepID=A0AAJ2HHD9_9MICO|nr:Na+/H+ antiporter subunit E [Microbacterium aurantiacum]MDS0245722.1 Na+/H+ antiporter subunit E [Microbacterium aurantiacum]
MTQLTGWLTWPFRLIGFVAWFATEVIVANFSVLRDNLTPGQNSTPGIARVPTRCETDAEITALAALVTLTPGTLTLGTTIESRTHARVLFVHGMYSDGPDALRAEVARIEDRLLPALRRKGDAR